MYCLLAHRDAAANMARGRTLPAVEAQASREKMWRAALNDKTFPKTQWSIKCVRSTEL